MAGMARIDVRADRRTVPTLTCAGATFGTDAFGTNASLRAALSPSLPMLRGERPAADAEFSFPFFSAEVSAAELFNGDVAAAVPEPLTVFVTLETAAATTGSSNDVSLKP